MLLTLGLEVAAQQLTPRTPHPCGAWAGRMGPIDIVTYICHTTRMHKTMVYLPEGLHKNLKRLAVERDSSVAELIRDAAVALVAEDEGDIAASRKALAEFRRDPSSAVALETYHRRRGSR